ncbi:fluoroacetate dehalogenase-like [Oppia nitens]|uniref:fluoroacetate dehalogenase-like n=1 Tax=Oppia nitens TaxID=1686743 RepID=UPI0023DC3EC8|nr:fluoroacetate dehalogenase-like [Oppia nitens]
MSILVIKLLTSILLMTSLMDCQSIDKKFFPNFETFSKQVNNVEIYGVKGGSGPPLLLLHGHPESHLEWHLVASELAKNFTVIASDLRGYGHSSAPKGSASHVEYSKREMAKDQVLLMESFGYKKFHVCAHDRGARVTHRMAMDWPDRLERAMLLDIAPTLAMYELTDQKFATAYWWWFFLIQPSPIPENFINARPDWWIDNRFPRPTEETEEFKKTLRNPAYVHAVCEDYRASATIDLDHDRRDREQGLKVQCPLRVLWGQNGTIGRLFHALDLWHTVAVNVTGRAVPSGHDIPELVPDILLDEVYEFFRV